MKKIAGTIFSTVFLIISCVNREGMNHKNSPLAIVIKLQTAEFLMDYKEAKNYIDINSVYSGKNSIENLSPEQAWVEMVSFMSNFTDKKFTRYFKYYDYDIIESINGVKAEVTFRPKNNGSKGLTYKLELRKDVWMVYDIDYKV